MAIIKISDFSKEAASKTKGLILKEKLLEHFDDDDLAVDFTGIEMFASPFFNNSFSALALIYGFEKINNIKKIGLDSTGQNTYDTSIENARLLSNSPQFSEQINDIVNNANKDGEQFG